MSLPNPSQLSNLPAEVASEIGTVRKLLRKLYTSETVVNFFGDLGKVKLGTAEVEEFLRGLDLRCKGGCSHQQVLGRKRGSKLDIEW